MQNTKRSPWFLTIIDLLTLCGPLLLLYFVLVTQNMSEEMLKRPEWSFVTVFIVVEILRDVARLGRSADVPIEHVEGGIVMYAILLAVSVVVLGLDFANEQGAARVLLKQVYIAKFALFLWAASVFSYRRHNRHVRTGKQEAT